jgi:hypothetical protein
MDILAKIFGSPARVKIMRLFLLNPIDAFENSDVVKKSKVTATIARKDLLMLNKVGFIEKKSFFKEIPPKTKKGKPKKKRVYGWKLNDEFPLLHPLHNLLINTEPLGKKEIVSRLKKCGNIKLIVISGVFIQNPDSRVDILIVGDKLKKSLVENTLSILESEVGKHISYAFFETPEFRYRLSVYDKFIRDILDYPNVIVLDKIGI